MQPYKDIDGDPGVAAYEIGPGSITVQFLKGGTYLYDGSKPGAHHVAEMQSILPCKSWQSPGIRKVHRR